MHRTYSLRNSRAPTASDLQHPPPPPSSTKTHKFFGKGSISHIFKRSIAGSMSPELSRGLTKLNQMEKNFMGSYELLSMERKQVAQQLSLWGEDQDTDLADITDKLGVLIYEISELESEYIDKLDVYRITLKQIRNIEDSVAPTRERKDKIVDKIAYMKYKDPNATDKITILEQELVRAEAVALVAEAQLSNYTRERFKAAFNYYFDAMEELNEKIALIANYGKLLLELVDDEPVIPGETRLEYDGFDASREIIRNCESDLDTWTQSTGFVRPTMSIRRTDLDGNIETEDEEEEEEGEEEIDSTSHTQDKILVSA